MKDSRLAYYVQNYFMSYLITQRGYGDNTIASYRDTFKLLFTFLKSRGCRIQKLTIADIDRECILQFLHWLETNRNNAITTRNVRLAHFKSFFGYVMSVSPEIADQCGETINIPFKKAEKRPPAYMTEHETKMLLNAPDSSTHTGLRHMAILSLLYDSGCRVQELIDLNVSDVTLGHYCKIFVRGKGDKYREIPIFGETGKILGYYIKTNGLKPDDALFTNSQGRRLTRAGISHIMNKFKDIVKKQHVNSFNSSISPHHMRHSKATHLVNAGVNIYNIRDFLGHASVVTTQIYLTSNPEVMRSVIENASQKTVPESTEYYSADEKTDLMAFLETLI